MMYRIEYTNGDLPKLVHGVNIEAVLRKHFPKSNWSYRNSNPDSKATVYTMGNPDPIAFIDQVSLRGVDRREKGC